MFGINDFERMRMDAAEDAASGDFRKRREDLSRSFSHGVLMGIVELSFVCER